MKIEFEKNINGYQEARKFKLIVDSIRQYDKLSPSLKSLVSSLQTQLKEFLDNPEFFNFGDDPNDDLSISHYHELEHPSFIRSIRRLFGPSRREIELSKQRQVLIERAEHAEISAFESLAETAEIGRERDELRGKLKQLKNETD